MCVITGKRKLDSDYQQEICRQANTGSTLLSAMGNPKPFPIYWDKILLNASQVTNPSIDPLREPMEIRTILGRKPDKMVVEKKGKSLTKMPPQVVLETPIMFSAMSFGSISLNAQKSLAMAAKSSAPCSIQVRAASTVN